MISRCLLHVFICVSLLLLAEPASAQSGSEGSSLLYDIGSPSMTKTIESEPESEPEPAPESRSKSEQESESVSSEVAALLRDLDSSIVKTRIRAAKIAARTAFDEDILYQKIEKKLRKGFKTRSDDRHHVDEMSWYCKALAATGKAKYAGVLKEAAHSSPSTKIQRHAEKSLSQISASAPESSRTEARNEPRAVPAAGTLNDQENKLLSMLGSADLKTVRYAAKRIYRSPKLNSSIYDAVDQKIRQLLPRAGKGRLEADTIAWLCKSLIISENRKYIPTLDKAIESADSNSVIRHARNARERLQ